MPTEDPFTTSPPQQPAAESGRAVPWSLTEIVLVQLIGLFFPAATYLLLTQAGWFHWLHGETLQEILDEGGLPAELLRMRMMLWATCAAFLPQVVLTLGFLNLTSGTKPADLGLTTRHLGRNTLAGLLFAFIFTPGAYAIQALVLWLWKFLDTQAEAHAFTLLGKEALYPVEWVLLFVAAVLIAPFWEELVYRGIIQPWIMARQPWGGPIAMTAALALTLAARWGHLQEARAVGGRQLLLELVPVATLPLLMIVYLILGRPGQAGERSGLFASAVLFAWVHAKVWPSPVPLLYLALGLGWLAWRGRSLVGCLVLHAVFNAVACILLIGSALWTK
jgi:membrane protease YdiL (CAAX protease family)